MVITVWKNGVMRCFPKRCMVFNTTASCFNVTRIFSYLYLKLALQILSRSSFVLVIISVFYACYVYIYTVITIFMPSIWCKDDWTNSAALNYYVSLLWGEQTPYAPTIEVFYFYAFICDQYALIPVCRGDSFCGRSVRKRVCVLPMLLSLCMGGR